MIEDNDKGFRLEQNPSEFGPQSMRERVAALRGDLHLETEPGSGCRINFELVKREPILRLGLV